MKKRKKDRKLTLSRETVAPLDAQSLKELRAGAASCTQESQVICSVMHTCVSCATTSDVCP